MKMIVEKQMECRLAGESEVLGENLPQRHFCPSQNPTWPVPGLIPGRRGGKPATNRLSYGAALSSLLTTTCFYTLKGKTMKAHSDCHSPFILCIGARKKFYTSSSVSHYYRFHRVIYKSNKTDLSPNTCMAHLPLYPSRSWSYLTEKILMFPNPPPAELRQRELQFCTFLRVPVRL
jgi:hypothetical protein